MYLLREKKKKIYKQLIQLNRKKKKKSKQSD